MAFSFAAANKSLMRDKILIEAVARVIITDTAGPLLEQVERRERAPTAAAKLIPTRARRSEVPHNTETSEPDLAFFNGLGGFTRGRSRIRHHHDSRECDARAVGERAGQPRVWHRRDRKRGRLYLGRKRPRVSPDNVVQRSRQRTSAAKRSISVTKRPVTSGRPAPLPARGAMPYTTRHGFGYTVFEHAEDGLSSELWTYVAIDAPVKFCRLKIRNSSGRARRLTVTGYVEWVLGEQRWKNALHIVTELDPQTGAVLARNPYNSEFPERVAFLAVSEPQRTVTADRTEFLGRNGTPADPAAMGRAALSGKVGPALDPCAALQAVIELEDGQEREVVFILGAAHDAATVSPSHRPFL